MASFVKNVKTFDELKEVILAQMVPVGSIFAWVPGYFNETVVDAGVNTDNGSFNSVSITLPDSWKICNGNEIYDEDSPIFNADNRCLPYLIDDRFLMGSTIIGTPGGNNDGHYHGRGTLAIGASGSHYHLTTDYQGSYEQAAAGTLYSTAAGSQGASGDGVVLYYTRHNTDSKTHTHYNSDIDGSVGNTGGVNGDDAGNNKPKYLSCHYIMRIK